MDFLNLSRDRYSVRKFNDQPVEQEKIDLILKSAMEAPTACNWQPFKVWVIRSPEAVEKVYETTPYTFGTKLFFVIGGNPDTAWVRKYDGKSFELVIQDPETPYVLGITATKKMPNKPPVATVFI